MQTALVALALAAGQGTALAQDSGTENDTPAIFTDHDPSLKNSPKFAPSLATAGMANPGPVLSQSPMTAAMLAGQGPGCTVLSPCAAVSSPPQRTGTARPDARRSGAKAKS